MVYGQRRMYYVERYPYCNWAVIAATCWVSFLGLRGGFQDAAFQEKYLFWPEAILAWKQYYRLLTSGFLHLDLRHLLMNMLSLYFFGPVIEQFYGSAQFLGIYFGAMIGGNLLSLYVHRHHDYRALGASGGVAGVIFAHIFLFPGGRIGAMFLPVNIPSWLYAILYLLASFYGMQRGIGNVGHDAHLGGALVGLFTAAALHPVMIRFNPGLYGAIAAGTILLVIYLVRNPLFLPMEGFDFTKSRSRPPSQAARSWWRDRFQRRKKPAAPARTLRPERQVDEIL